MPNILKIYVPFGSIREDSGFYIKRITNCLVALCKKGETKLRDHTITGAEKSKRENEGRHVLALVLGGLRICICPQACGCCG